MSKTKQKAEYVQPGTYAPGEVPEYAFCESVSAGSCGHWHIRKVQSALHLGGGIDTPSLCGHVKAHGGWDINVKITEHHLGHSCSECVKAYREVEH